MIDTFHYLCRDGRLLVGAHRSTDLARNINVLGWWKVNTFDYMSMYDMIIESIGITDEDNVGTTLLYIYSYTEEWKIQLDGQHLLTYLLASNPGYIARKGVNRFILYILEIDPDEYWDWIKKQGETPDFTTMPVNKEQHA